MCHNKDMRGNRGARTVFEILITVVAVGIAGPCLARSAPLLERTAVRMPSLARGLALLKQGHAAQAIRALKQALKEDPTVRDYAFFNLGEAYFSQRRYRRAAAMFGQALKAQPSRFADSATERMADAMQRAGQPLPAIKIYRRLLKSYPAHPERARVLLSLAQALAKARRGGDAVPALREIWVEWPERPEADGAEELLRELQSKRLKIPAPTLDEAVQRARRLRRLKEFDEAIAELTALRARHPEAADRLDLQLVYTYRKAQRPHEALDVVHRMVARERAHAQKDKRKSGRRPSTRLRALHVELLAWTGRVDEALTLALEGVPPKPGRQHRPALILAMKLLAEHARYEEALRYAELLASVTGPHSYPLRRAWLAYRAGKYDLAIERFGRLPRRERGRGFSLYWQARAHAKAGHTDEAVRIYQQLVEQELRSYYGQLARSRLVELGKLSLERRACAPLEPPPKEDLGEALSTFLREHGALFPLVKRAATLQRHGLLAEMRRELNVAAMDFGWAAYRGRRQQFNVRSEVARLWRGGEASKRRWRLTPEERKLRRLKREEQAELRQAFGALLRKAGVFYFGWKLDKPDENITRQIYPRAYLDVVANVARHEDLDPNFVWSIMRKESAYRADAISRVRAGGLMQLMPYTATRLAGEKGMARFSFARVFEPRLNVTLAAHYLRALYNKFRGQLQLVAAAYNGGPHNIARWLAFRGATATMDEFIEEIPYRESRLYSQRVMLLLSQYERTYCNKDDRLFSNTLNPRFNEYPSY